MRRHKWEKSTVGEALRALLLFALAGSLAVAVSCLWQTSAHVLYGKTSGDFLLMTTQCALGLLGLALPAVMERKLRLHLPPFIYAMYYAFLLCAVFLGEILAFYDLFPLWDVLLHVFSGAMLCALGFVLAKKAGLDDPLWAAAAAFCFSLALGAVWEMYEYAMDGVLHMNMQKFADAQRMAYIGRAALSDTMQDIWADALAALCTAAAGYFVLRRKQREK